MKRFGHFEYDSHAELATLKTLAARLQPMLVDGLVFLEKERLAGKRILIEGANALMLDLDVGTYPFVTSSNCSIGGIFTGLGMQPRLVNQVVGVVKAYTTRVGGGPFPTELTDEIGDVIGIEGAEYGTTTGRRRRCGWLDMMVLKHSNRVNGYTVLNLTKLDVLSSLKELKIAVAYRHKGQFLEGFPSNLDVLHDIEVIYETLAGWMQPISTCRTFSELPLPAREYVRRIEALSGIPIRWIGVGPCRNDIIELE